MVFSNQSQRLRKSNSFSSVTLGLLSPENILDRSNGESKIDKTIVSQIEIKIPTYKTENLPKHLENIKAIKPGSRNL